jgi:hypothetical protein
MIKLKHDMIVKNNKNAFGITTDWILNEIEAEIKILDKIKTQQKINDRLNNSGAPKAIGFSRSSIEEDMDCQEEYIGKECSPEDRIKQ